VAGTVQSINGSTIVVQRQQDNSTATVQISSSTTIRKQDVGALSDLQPGANLIAFGQTANNVFQAQQIQLGTGQFPGRTGGNGGGNGGNGSNGGGNNGGNGNGGNGGGRPGPGGGAPGQVLAGTVDSVSGNTVTVKANDGSTTQLQLAANGRIVKTSNGTAADIQTGEFLIATGQDQGTTLDATNVTVSPAGFTGFGGGRRNATPSPTP
jgi:preprotein translocase subunit YajC